MEKITDILLCEIETEDGRKLGRLFDVRSDGEPEHGIVNKDRRITALLYGRTGLLEVVGLKKTEVEFITSEAIKRITRGKIVVSNQVLE